MSGRCLEQSQEVGGCFSNQRLLRPSLRGHLMSPSLPPKDKGRRRGAMPSEKRSICLSSSLLDWSSAAGTARIGGWCGGSHSANALQRKNLTCFPTVGENPSTCIVCTLSNGRLSRRAIVTLIHCPLSPLACRFFDLPYGRPIKTCKTKFVLFPRVCIGSMFVRWRP